MALNLIMASGAVLWLMLGGASGYIIDFFDCHSPTRIERFARPTAWDPFAAEEETTTGTTYEVLTEAETREVNGWSWSPRSGRYRCGVFSHLKLASVPHLMRYAKLSLAECRRMVRQLEYTPQGRASGLPLRLNTWNFFSVTASGDLETFPDHIECQGEETRHGYKMTENKVVLLELRIMVRDENFIINHGVIESEHLQLPYTVQEESC